MDQGPGVERCAVGPIVKMGQRLRDAGAQEIVGDLGSVAALLAGTQALSPGEAQPKQFGIVMGEADIGDAGGKKARAAAACFDPCLRLLRAEAAQALVGQRVEQRTAKRSAGTGCDGVSSAQRSPEP